MAVLRRIAKFNKKEIPSNIELKAQENRGKTTGSFCDLFRPLQMAKKTMVQFYAWYVSTVNAIYFGNSLIGLSMNYCIASLRPIGAHSISILFKLTD